MRQILVALDDTAASERVVEFVNDFFDEFDVKITAVNIGQTTLPWGPYLAAPGLLYPWPYVATMPATAAASTPVREDEAPEAAAAAERTLVRSGLRADDTVVELGGDVSQALRRVATELHVDLLVVGASDKSLLERLFSPSVSKDLVKSAPVPVLVVH